MNTCATCRFSKVVYEHQATIAQCRRRAPVIGGAFGHTTWPKVGLEFWCGDFELKPELRSCKTCDKPVGEIGFSAPHFTHATLYPICRECYNQFSAGTHPFQKPPQEYPGLKELQKGQH